MSKNDYYSEKTAAKIQEARKTVQFMLHNPPDSKTRLKRAYERAMRTIDSVLWLAECYAQQTYGSVLPNGFSKSIQEAYDKVLKIDSEDQGVVACRAAMELINDFRQMKEHHIHPDAILSDICASLKIKEK